MNISFNRLLLVNNTFTYLKCLGQNKALENIQNNALYCKRNYRGRPSHNIGRMHGLEKIKPPPLTQRQQGIWDEELHRSSVPNAHDTLNFNVEGYDMVLVERFTKYVHRFMLKHKQKVIEVYALPSNDVEVRKMVAAKQQQIEDMIVDVTLTSHKRVVQVANIPSSKLSILLETIIYNIPQSIKFSLKKHDEAQHFLRFQRKVELEEEKEILQKLISSK